jgi:hypothetical protein
MPAPVKGILYHQPVIDPRGNALFPMHQLRSHYPDLYQHHLRNYDGQRELLVSPVEPLQCTWGDVVFLSPVHPAPLFDAIARPYREPWTLDAARLDPERTVIRLMRHGNDGHYPEPPDEDDYLPLTTATLRAVNRVSQAAIDRLSRLQPGDPALPWVDVPHILHRGSIPIDWFTRPDDAHPPATPGLRANEQ